MLWQCRLIIRPNCVHALAFNIAIMVTSTRTSWNPSGDWFNMKMAYCQYKINSIVEIRRSYDRLTSTVGFPILVRHLYIESGPRALSCIHRYYVTTMADEIVSSHGIDCVGLLCPSSPWASYQMRKNVGCACTGNAGNVFPATDFNGNR